MMILAAQIADPVRVILVLFLVWMVTKLYDPGERIVPTLIALAGAAVALTIVLASLATTPLPEGILPVHTLVGFCANLILWACFAGLRLAYRWQRNS